MNSINQKADNLTRALLKDCRETPPKGMDLKIMDLIQKEAPLKRPVIVDEGYSQGGIIALGIGCLLLILVGLLCLSHIKMIWVLFIFRSGSRSPTYCLFYRS